VVIAASLALLRTIFIPYNNPTDKNLDNLPAHATPNQI
jgi:hypothetical protein